MVSRCRQLRLQKPSGPTAGLLTLPRDGSSSARCSAISSSTCGQHRTVSRVAESLGFTVITVLPKNANERGIVGAAVRVLSDHQLSIRQIFVTDPEFSEEPKLVIIVEDPLPAGVIEKIRALPQVRQVII